MICPDCNGAGFVVMHVVGRMSDSNPSGIGTYPCSRCHGKKVVPDEPKPAPSQADLFGGDETGPYGEGR